MLNEFLCFQFPVNYRILNNRSKKLVINYLPRCKY